MIYVVNGVPGSGKTLFEENVQKISNKPVILISTITFVKQIAMQCGWNGEKTPKDREFLSNLKKLLKEWNDVPFQMTIKRIESAKLYFEEEPIIFVDCREPEEISRLCEKLGAKSILIRRTEAEMLSASNSSDDCATILNYPYDYVLYNNGTKEEWFEESKKFSEN